MLVFLIQVFVIKAAEVLNGAPKMNHADALNKSVATIEWKGSDAK